MSAEGSAPAVAVDPGPRLLTAVRDDLLALLARSDEDDMNRTTVCDGDVLLDVAARPDDDPGPVRTAHLNELGVARRRLWPRDALAEETRRAFEPFLDPGRRCPVALGVWVHLGDIREGLGDFDPYAGPALADALTLLVDRSVARGVPPVDVTLSDAAERGLADARVCLGEQAAEPVGWLRVNAPGLFRITAGRRIGLVEREIVGIAVEQLLLFA